MRSLAIKSFKIFPDKLYRNKVTDLDNPVDIAIKKFENHPSIKAVRVKLKVNNRNTRTRCEICSQLTIKAPDQRHFYC